MKDVTIIIPTRNRDRKLKRCLDSINKRSFDGTLRVKIWVFCDGGDRLFNHDKIDEAFASSVNIGSVATRNLMASQVPDGMIWATDDIVFKRGAIARAVEMFNEIFPDDDGVVGFKQEGNSYHPTGVGLMGKNFLKRYPFKQFLYPGYWLFAAQEILDLAFKLDRFIETEDPMLYHYHPAFHIEEHDQTHKDGRKFKERDKALRKERQAKGLIWGHANESSGSFGAIQTEARNLQNT